MNHSHSINSENSWYFDSIFRGGGGIHSFDVLPHPYPSYECHGNNENTISTSTKDGL